MIDFDTLFEGHEFARTRYEQLIPKLKVILELDDADVSRKPLFNGVIISKEILHVNNRS